MLPVKSSCGFAYRMSKGFRCSTVSVRASSNYLSCVQRNTGASFLNRRTENYLTKPQKNENMKDDDVCVSIISPPFAFCLPRIFMVICSLMCSDLPMVVGLYTNMHAHTYIRIIIGPRHYRRLVGGTKARVVSFL